MATPPPTRVIVLAPATLYRAAWQALLAGQPDIVVAGGVASPGDLAALLDRQAPTTILVDLLPPQPEIARQLRVVSPTAGLLFLVHTYDLAEILPLLQAGVTGCLARDASVADLARAIIAVGRGELVLPLTLAAQALTALAQGEPFAAGRGEPLSERETGVLHLLARGLTNKDIAQTLIISVRTVEAHLRSIFGKLGVRSRTEAALWAVRHGYGSEEE